MFLFIANWLKNIGPDVVLL